LSARLDTEYGLSLVSGEADIESRARSVLSYEGKVLLLQWRLEVHEAGQLVHESAGEQRFARGLHEETTNSKELPRRPSSQGRAALFS
jgi:hypothetical protein